MKEEEIMKIDREIGANNENFTDRGHEDNSEETGSAEGNAKRTKSQKAGLNAIRPDDYVEKTFKDLAKNKGKSQTELFEAMFWNYINEEQEKEMEDAISFKSEINLISSDLENILKHFKRITDKAQSTIMAERNNALQKLENLQKELDTADLKNRELLERNRELETSNEAFTSIKEGLSEKISDLKEALKNRDSDIRTLQQDIEEYKILNSKYSARIAQLEASNKEKELEEKRLKESLDKHISTYQFESEKRTRLESEINDLRMSLQGLKESCKEEKESLEKALILKYEAEKNMAVVDVKLELIDIKNNLQEKLVTINKLNQIVEENKDIITELKKRLDKDN
jgi:chromosome segregation ATPase